MKPNFSKSELIERARRLIEEQGRFIIAYDVVSSSLLSTTNRMRLVQEMKRFHNLVNSRLYDKTAEFDLNTIDTVKGMVSFVGDSGGGAFNDTSVIEEVLKIADGVFNSELRWSVGKDMWDENITKLIR